MRIGIFGGSFNPVHKGHLKLAQNALSELSLNQIFFVPSYKAPLKAHEKLLSNALRVKLLKAALKGKPHFKLSLCELNRKGTSYTIDTLRFFRKKHGKDTVLFFLSGGDTSGSLRRWKSWKQVLKLCHFVLKH